MRMNLPGAYPGFYSRPVQPKFGMTVAQTEPRFISGSEELKARCAAASTEEGATLVFRDWKNSPGLLREINETIFQLEDNLMRTKKVQPEDKERLQAYINAFIQLAECFDLPSRPSQSRPDDARDTAIESAQRILTKGVDRTVARNPLKPLTINIADYAIRLRVVKSYVDDLPVN